MFDPQHKAASKHPNAVRYVLPILGLIVLVMALAGIKVSQISTLIHMGKEMQKAGPPPDAVSTSVAQMQTWEGALSSVGSIVPVKGVELSNDAPGIVSKIHFESGEFVKQGQVLVELDSSVERAQLESAKARKDLANLTVGRSRALLESKTIAPAQVDSDEAQLKTSTTDLGALQAQIDRKILRAPFAGRLGIRAVNLGQYLNPGTTVTVLEAIDSVYVDFSLPQQRLGDVKLGMPVRVTIEGAGNPPQDGAIAAIDPSVDTLTRTIRLRATVPNKQEKLRPGMFANVSVVLPSTGPQVTIPNTSLIHASYGDSVFVVEPKKDTGEGASAMGPGGNPIKSARQQFVRVGETRGDFISILDGVTVGQEIVSAGAFKLRNGSSVIISSDVKPPPQLNPHPDNR